MSFSNHTRWEIRDRSPNTSELTGEFTIRPMECSHLNHSRSFDTYDYPDNAVYCTDLEHLAYHLLFRNRPEQIGLKAQDNNSAIVSLLYRVQRTNRKLNIDREQYEIELQRAKSFWLYHLGMYEEP